MDDLDRAQKLTEQSLEIAISNRDKTQLSDTGLCHYCSDPIEKGHFCDSGCRDDYQQMNRGVL